MKKILTAAALVAVMTLPALAEGDDPSTAAGEGKGTVKATTDVKQNSGSDAMGQGVVIRRSTTGSATDNQLNKEENSSPANPGKKTGISGGNDSGGNDSGGSSSGNR